jgi:hypothetical protein
MNNPPSLYHVSPDCVGAWLSVGCAVHCMALPLLFGILPVFGLRFLLADLSETLFLLTSTGLAVVSLCWGFRMHRKCRANFLLAAGALMMIAGRSLVDDVYELRMVVLGALSVAAAYLTNRQLCRSCLHCQGNQRASQTGGQT